MRRFITSDDIYALMRAGKTELVIGKDDQMTDIVREMIRRRGIRVVRSNDAAVVSGNMPQEQIVPPAASPVNQSAPSSFVGVAAGNGNGDYDLVVRGGIVVLPEAGRVALSVCVKNGKIAALTTENAVGKQIIDARGKYVFPGIVDPHTHLGLYAPLETELETETRSALIGGVTTVGAFFNHTGSYLPTISMLENTVPRYARIDVVPHFTLRDNQQLSELSAYSARGMNSFKMYMCGVPGLFPHQEDGFVLSAMQRLKELYADPVLCIHAENTSIVDYATESMADLSIGNLEQWAQTHPNIAEGEAVIRSAYFSQQTGVRTYVVHNSCKESMEALRKVKHDKLFVETTSPYLTRDTQSDIGVRGKMLPPFREPESRLALWQGIRDGIVDTIGTDNVTMTLAEKKYDQGMSDADPGYPALATHLVSVLNEGFFKQEIAIEKLVPLMTMNPAKIFGLYPRKGTLLPGADADIVIVDMERAQRVDPAKLMSRSDFSLYQGEEMRGWPVCTIKGGRVAVVDGRIVDESGRGQVLRH